MAAEFTLGDRALIEGRLIWPESGAIRGSFEIDGEDPISGAVTLGLPGVDIAVTIVSGGLSDTRVYANFNSGGGTLSQFPVEGQHLYQATPRTIFEQILNGSGETLFPEMPAICDQAIAHWMRIATTADNALAQLVRHLGLAYWFEPDGRVRIGQIDYPEVTLDTLDVLPLDRPEWKRLDFADDDEIVQPRTTLVTDYGSYRVVEVRYYLARGIWRGEIFYEDPATVL